MAGLDPAIHDLFEKAQQKDVDARHKAGHDETEAMARPAIHPGEILADELAELAVSPTELARQIRVPASRITQIVQG